MELKGYQKRVVDDLGDYLGALKSSGGIAAAWRSYWGGKDVKVRGASGTCGVPAYNDELGGVPNVCIKVPTGGGKTFIGANAISRIFAGLPLGKYRAVVWLVPSDAILEQTVRNLSDPSHPYRRRLDADFGGRVAVFTKEQLLGGQGFQPDTVEASLCVCVFCYNSIRAKPRTQEDRKVYQANGGLMAFAPYFADGAHEDGATPDTALVSVIRRLNPVVVVDESHNATSALSVEMLKTLNPSFVLSMTATPAKGANIISYVGAMELKRADMVKLPVIVRKCRDVRDVLQTAISLRVNLARSAKAEEQRGGPYVRPIVLVQAQPKTGEGSETYARLKEKLVKCGIPEREIAVKTGDRDELKGVDLMSRTCEVRYVITVNALKEGWDCPFAYILASVANKTSATDVEQVVGRVLRLPGARRSGDGLLNMSYVLSCSNDFQATVVSVVKGLNNAGFSEEDYRVSAEPGAAVEAGHGVSQPDMFAAEPGTATGAEPGATDATDEDGLEGVGVLDVPSEDAPTGGGFAYPVPDDGENGVVLMVREALRSGEEYDARSASADPLQELKTETGMKSYRVKEAFAEELEMLRVPVFAVGDSGSLWSGGKVPFDRKALTERFSLAQVDATIRFSTSLTDAVTVDVEEGDSEPKCKYLSGREKDYLARQLAGKSTEERVRRIVGEVAAILDREIESCETREIRDYVARAVAGLGEAQREALDHDMIVPLANCIRAKIEALEAEFGRREFDRMVSSNEITLEPLYAFPEAITPADAERNVAKSLYEGEYANMNGDELRVAQALAGKANVRWWHRIRDRAGFCINGFINHYPDFAVMTQRGNLVMVEVKGSHLDGTDSREKAALGRTWADNAGTNFKYFMVFNEEKDAIPEAKSLEDFLTILDNL